MARPGRQVRGSRAFGAGRWAEHAAALFLRFKGYRILARRYKTPVGEIDLVAERGRTLAFVEVKWRPTARAALEAIPPRQRDRVSRAANWYLSRAGALNRLSR